ncbi:unnamed protein product [Rotaria sp. Silwood2]|nr:unnamed protein product [Rotaria sp. Silwood2]
MISIRLIDMLNKNVTRRIKQKGQQQLRIFGYHKTVHELKRQYQDFFNRHQLQVFNIQINPAQMDYLLYMRSREVKQIETKYKADGVSLQIKSQKFVAPVYLKDEISKQINDLLLNMRTAKFQTIELFQAIAEREVERLKNIARRNKCHINKYELETDSSKLYIVPKVTSSNADDRTSSKVLREQSDLFCSSTGVIRKFTLNNGSISVSIGDITKKKVDVIVVSSTSNGLRERIIEQAGLDVNSLKCEPNQQKSSVRFIEATSGQVSCKTILFSNWTPPMNIDNDGFRRSAQVFISKSIQYAIIQLKAESVAFALPDLYDKEDILVDTIFQETRHQIKRSSTCTVSFVFLSDQQTLFEMFSKEMEKLQDVLQFSFPTATMQINLLSSSSKSLKKCRNKIKSHLDRLMIKSKLEFNDDNSAFKKWNQHMINAFYLYCKERCVLAITLTNNSQVIELCGPSHGIQEVREKYRILDTLQKQKLQIQTTFQSNSVAHRRPLTASSTVTTNTTRYNIMLSYCSKDQARCQRLANRLIDDGFSVLMVDRSTTRIKIDTYDCIIVCLSQYSQENDEAIKNVINESGTKIILAKVQYFNTSVSGWLHDYLIGKLCYYLYGSDNYFNLEYDKIMLEVLNITKPGHVSLLQSTINYTDELQQLKQQIEQQRRHMYDKRLKKLTKLGKIPDDDMKNSIDILHAMINEEEAKGNERTNEAMKNDKRIRKESINDIQHLVDISLLLYRRWLKKAPNIIKQNIPPYTLTGDINDAIFPMPDDMRTNPEQFIKRYFLKYSPFSTTRYGSYMIGEMSRIASNPYGKIPDKQLQLVHRTFGISSTQMSQQNEQLISKRSCVFSANIKLVNVWANVGFIGSKTKSENEMKRRQQLDENDSVMQEFRDMKTKEYMNKYPTKRKQISEFFKKFMKQKAKNTMEFHKLCETYFI